MLSQWVGKKSAELSKALVMALVVTSGFLSPFLPIGSEPSFASGDPGWDSELDYALTLNGTSQHASVSSVVMPQSNFFVGAWVREDVGASDVRAIVSQGDAGQVGTAFELRLLSSGGNRVVQIYRASGGVGTNNLISNVVVPQGQWSHVGVSYDDSAQTHTIFLNGQPAQTWAGSPNSSDFTGNFFVGLNYFCGCNNFDGQLDEVTVWNSTKNETQVSALMHARASGSDLVGYWDFNEPSGSTAFNRTGSGVNLSLIGSPGRTDVKQVTNVAGGDTVVTFPRTYLPGVRGWTAPSNARNVRALVVAGGGAGNAYVGGGGGGGGVLAHSFSSFTNSTYSIVVGQGGLSRGNLSTIDQSARNSPGANGQNTTAFGQVALGGGGGGLPGSAGVAGGSGGGAGFFDSQVLGGAGTPGQGFAGGQGVGPRLSPNLFTAGAGGGGAAGLGENVDNTFNRGGDGGAGTASSILGTQYFFGGGGGGGAYNATTPSGRGGHGGIGGGGAGSVLLVNNTGTPAVANGGGSALNSGESVSVGGLFSRAGNGGANTGGGGGGTGHDGISGAGGSGVVIVRYTLVNTITFVSNGSDVSPISADTGSAVAQPSDPTTTSESVFLGWSTVAGSVASRVGWPYTPGQSTTLYGLWASSPGVKSEIDYALDLPGTGTSGFGTDSGQVLPASSSFTVEVWVKPDSLPYGWNQVVHNFAGNNLGRFDINVGNGVTGSNLIQIIYNPRTSDAENGKFSNVTFPRFVAPIGEWTHIAVSIEVDKANSRYILSAYRNGYLAGSPITITGITFQNLEDNFYAGYFTGRPRTFDGQIDQVKVWDGVLSQAQIEQSMHALGTEGVTSPPALRARYDFNEAPSTATVTDRTLLGRDLVQVGTPTRVDTKQSSTANGTTTLTFPRTYLPGVGGWTPPAGVANAELLVVGGGGGSAGNSSVASFGGAAGSGGGGGVFRSSSVGLASPSAIKVGTGGLGGVHVATNAGASGSRGQSSAFRSLTAGGGGAGGCEAQGSTEGAVCVTAAASGGAGTAAGSGGSPSNFYNAYSPGFAGTATATVMDGITYAAVPGNRGGYYNDGGSSTNFSAGSAGGAGGAGNRNTPGAGLSSTISGAAVSYGTGGASWTSSSWVDAAPAANRGTGGNGAYKASGQRGYDGSAGVVILRYTVATSPVITAQPQTVSATPGSTANFSVTATGNGTLSYQWQESSDGTNWQNVGLNQSTHSISNVAFGDAGRKIRVIVTNTINGTVSLTSDVVTLNVTGVTLTVGACSAMVANATGVTISEALNGGCVVRMTATGSNTFFVPEGVTSLRAILVGGGGGGGAARLMANRGGGGGGGGAGAFLNTTITVTSSQELAVSLGAGGAGGVNSNGASGSASTLTFGNSVFSTSFVVPGGQGGLVPSLSGGRGSDGGAGSSITIFTGANGGRGATHPATRTTDRPVNGSPCSRATLFSEFGFCFGGGGGGGNRELASDPFFNFVAVSTPASGINLSGGGSGGYHNGTAVVPATTGLSNTTRGGGGGGGGGSYEAETNTFRSGAAGADGVVMFAFTPGAGEISLSSVAPFSFSATTKTIALTKQNSTTNVTWTTSNTAVCTVTGDASSATVTPVSAGVCEVTVNLAAQAPYGKGTAATSFRIDKITRTAPTWINSSLSIPFSGTFDLRTNINTPGQNVYAFSTSGTAGSCSVTGYTLTVGSVGDSCNVAMSLAGDAVYEDVPAATALSVTVTRISQSGLVITSGNQMNVAQSLTVSAAGGSGPGAISYHLVSDGGTGCQINSTTGELSGATAAGSCTVYAKRATSTNYDEVTSSNQVVTVNKINQVLSWVTSPQPIVLAGGQYIIEATASSQLQITYSIGSGLCIITGNTVTFTGSGDCVIRAAQPGSTGYLVAQTISQTVSVGKINQTMTFSAIANKSWGSLAFSLSAAASSGLTIAYTKNNQTTNDSCDVSAVGVVTIKNIGLCAITATQAGDSAYTSVVTTQVFEVTPNPAGAPFIGSISFGDRQLNASFFTPSYLGGGTITAYELRAYKQFDGSLAAKNSGCIAQPGANQTCSVIGLENGEVYVLRVAAITQAGLGQLSASSSGIVPAANPEAVSNLVAIEGNGQLTIRWSPAASLGGGNFDQYRIFWRAPGTLYQPNGSPGATVGNRNSTSFVITGLQNGVAYDVKVTTVTSINTLELESNTAEVRQTPFTVPDAPASVAAFDNGAKVLVAWQAPVFDGGNAIDQYVVTKDGATVCSITSGSSTSCEVTKPTSGTSTIEVKAGNDAGLSLGTQATFTVFSFQPGTGPGGISSLPTTNTATTKPVVNSVEGPRSVKPASSITLNGENFLLVQRVLVEGIEATYVVTSDKVMTLRLPAGLKAGEVSITFLGSFGTFILSNYITVVPEVEVPISSKVTIGSFNGFAAVYTKNLEGKRLSIKFGNKWRVVSTLPANYTINLLKLSKGKSIETKVYVDRKLVKVQQLKIR